MYEFQEVGTQFLVKARRAILADDMGLGKTKQALNALDILGCKRVLIVCPKGLIGVWEDEIARWSRGVIHTATSQTIKGLDGSRARFTLLNYEIIGHRLSKGKVDVSRTNVLKGQVWDAVVFDEAHRLKNRSSRAFRGAKSITGCTANKGGVLFLLTGTPLINSVDELWPLLHLIDPTKYSSYWRWVNEECYTQVSRWSMNPEILGPKDASGLRRKLSNIMLRRTKEHVLAQLPKKTYVNIPIDLTEEQYGMLRQIKKNMMAEYGDAVVDTTTALAQIIRMRQVCISPGLIFGGSLQGPKIDAVLDMLEDTTTGKVVVFSQFEKVIADLAGKVRERFGRGSYVVVTGPTSLKDRGAAVTAFQDSRKGSPWIFLSTMQTGGVGYTLTQSSTVIFTDLAWSPAMNRQAQDRVHRIGQVNPVTIYMLTARRSVEEYILKVLGGKENLFRRVIPEFRMREIAREAVKNA